MQHSRIWIYGMSYALEYAPLDLDLIGPKATTAYARTDY
jgi:hypothetical protein